MQQHFTESPVRGLTYAAFFGALTALGAYLIIPMVPVPITLQTLFCGLSGALLGSYLGAMSQAVYLLLGVIGLPVFAGGKSGLGILFGPTGGYLVGFVAAAFVTGKVMALRRSPSFCWTLSAIGAGQVVLYGLGILQLSLVAKLSLEKALWVGLLPFLPGDLLKITAAAVLCRKLVPYLARRSQK